MTRTKYFKEPNSGTYIRTVYATIYFLKIVLPMQPHYVPLSKMDFKQFFVKLLKLTGKKFRQISYLVIS